MPGGRRLPRALLLFAGLLGVFGATRPQPDTTLDGWRTLTGDRRDVQAAEAFLKRLMSEYHVTALSVAVLDQGRTVFARTLGSLSAGAPADARTVFRAASLTKPVFAYLVMKLVDEGVLGLDTPLCRYLDKPLHEYPAYASLRGDARVERMTARLLLSHQGGLPNWRRVRPDGPIRFHSDPGDRFAYSGEGYCLLQFVIEQVTGRGLATLARDKVFEPLGMRDTSFLWEARFDGRFAVDLDGPLGGLVQKTRLSANAAASLVTNAPDYARFAAAVMSGEGLSPGARAAMLEPRVALTSRSLFSAPGTDRGANRAHKMAWTPGWGTFEDQHGPALFHVGMEEGCENYVELFPGRGLGAVFLSLTTSLESFSAPLVDYALGPAFSPLAWLEYGAPPPANRTPAGALAAAAGLAAGVLGLALLARRWRGRGGAR